MPPMPSIKNSDYSLLGDAKFCANPSERNALFSKFKNLKDFFGSQFGLTGFFSSVDFFWILCHPMILTRMLRSFFSFPITLPPSALFLTIQGVFFWSSKKEMAWVYARWIVTFVTYMKRLIHFIVMDLIRNSMRPSWEKLSSYFYGKKSVAFFILVSNPLPALTKMIDVGLNRSVFVGVFPKPSDVFFGEFYHKQKVHRPAKVMSEQGSPQSQNDGLNLFESLAFNSHIKAASIFNQSSLMST